MFGYLSYSFYVCIDGGFKRSIGLHTLASSDFSEQNVMKIMTKPTTRSPGLSGEIATANMTDLSGFYTQNFFPPNTALDSLTLQPVLNSSLVLLSPSNVTHFSILIFCEHNYNSAFYYMLHFLVKTSVITK